MPEIILPEINDLFFTKAVFWEEINVGKNIFNCLN